MDQIDAFLRSPEAVSNYELLESIGVIREFTRCKKRIHDLEELLSDALEIFDRQNNEDLVDYLISSIINRFVPTYLQFTFQSRDRSDQPRNICFENLEKIESPAPIASLEPFEEFFNAYPGTISFSLFEYSVEDPVVAESLKSLNPEILIPITGAHQLYGLIVIGKKAIKGEYTDEEMIYLDRLMQFVAASFQNSPHYSNSVTDFKTKLYNHTFFERRLTEELAKVKRYGSTIAVMLIDVDFFKQLNERYGHLAGDKVLYRIGRILEKSLRLEDIIARLGSGEIALLLPESSRESAYHVAERIRREIAEAQIPYLGNIIRVTVSIGLHFVDKVRLDTPKGILAQTAKALQISKEGGRNRVSYHKPGLLFRVNHQFFGTIPVPEAEKRSE